MQSLLRPRARTAWHERCRSDSLSSKDTSHSGGYNSLNIG